MTTQPYLIQRATINHPLAAHETKLSDSVNFDYMGSAEFEFGALPKSLRRLQEMKGALTQRKVDRIVDGERSLRIVSALTDAEFEEYVGYLVQLRTGKPTSIRTKEMTYFDIALMSRFAERRNPATDFWWDIQNNVMFSFDKLFMNRLVAHLEASWAYMDSNKETK